MFDNIGKKIQILAIVSTIIGFILSIAGAIYCWVNQMTLVGFVILIFGCLFAWLFSFFTYGFGELIIQTTNVAKRTQRMQMLTIYDDSSKISTDAKEIIDNIENEVLEEYEIEKYDYNDELAKINKPNIDECPCCFNKINPADTECSYCGHKLK